MTNTNIPALDWILDGDEEKTLAAIERIEYLKAIKEFDVYQAIVDADMEDPYDALWETENYVWFDDAFNFKQLGYYLLCDSVDDELMYYIDLIQYGKDYDAEMKGKFVDGGYIAKIQ